MGASSVTGVSGPGEGVGKGPGNGRNTFVPLNAPRIMAAGAILTDDEGGATIEFVPAIPGTPETLTVQVTTVGNPTTAVGRSFSDGLNSITIGTEDPETYCYWAIISAGSYFGN